MHSIRSIQKIIIWGAKGHSKVLVESLRDTNLPIVAFFDNDRTLTSWSEKIPLLHGVAGFERWLDSEKTPQRVGFLVAIGGDNGRERMAIQNYLLSKGLTAISVIHRSAFVAECAVIGSGSQVLANASVCVEARIGSGCIVNTGATVDHECRIENGVHVCPGAHLAGMVSVGSCATVGTGATILPRVRIGKDAVVGAGSTVVRNVAPNTIVVGVPARVLAKQPVGSQKTNPTRYRYGGGQEDEPTDGV